MKDNVVFYLIGRPHAGKKLAAALLGYMFRVSYMATSSVIFDAMARQLGCSRWELEVRDKDSLRKDMVAVGDGMCAGSPAGIVAPLLDRGVRVVSGIKRKAELEAACFDARARGLAPVVVWFSRCVGEVSTDNTEVTKEDADYVISNLGSVEHLIAQVTHLAGEFGAFAGAAPDAQGGGNGATPGSAGGGATELDDDFWSEET